ncbi:MAG: hypothetical protein JRC99_00575, partial [Deltaproteobacteria bacterium]|nr:hypothetical protein [Deltaproteobacteria bacterium]
AVIEKQQKGQKNSPQKIKKPDQKQIKPADKPQTKKLQRYIYSDSKGELQFADSLDEVPEEYRKLAQPMGE